MSKNIKLGMFIPFVGFRMDSGAATYPEINTDTQLINDAAKKNIVVKIRGVDLPHGLVKFSEIKKIKK